MQSGFATFKKIKMENNRRTFLKQAGVAAAGLMIIPSFGCMATTKPGKIGIQLYSLRNEYSKGVERVISEVAKAGYNTVETYGYSVEKGFWGLSSGEFKALLDKYKLTTPSAHYDFEEWEKSQDDKILQSYIDASKVLEQKYIVIPYMDPQLFKSEQWVRGFAEKLNRVGEIVKKAGLKLAYHNHAFEFEQFGNKTGYDILLENTNKDLVDFEIDLYWAVRAKQDVIALFKKHPGRFTMWHIKDMSKSNPNKNTEIGNGSIDFSLFYTEAKLAGLKYSYVEQENFDIDTYESIQRSFTFLNEMK